MVDITAKKSGVFLLCAFVFIWYIVPRLGEEFLSRCFGNIISLILAYVIAIQLNEGKIEIQGKAVLVTGCDTGIGNAVARYLDKLGFRVFAGCLFEDGTGARRLKDECSGRMQVVQMDLTNEHQVAEVARFVQSAVAVSGEGNTRIIIIPAKYRSHCPASIECQFIYEIPQNLICKMEILCKVNSNDSLIKNNRKT